MKLTQSDSPFSKSDSPLSKIDARIRLLFCLITSLSIVLPFRCLVLLIAGLSILLAWGQLFKVIYHYCQKFFWILIILALANTFVVDFNFALLMTLRILLLALSFTIITETISIDEIYLIFRWLRCPYHVAFSISVALRFFPVLDQEWQTIREAQQARGIRLIKPEGSSLRRFLITLKSLLPFLIPIIVLTVKRAWNLTEAAYLRGIDSPFEEKVPSLPLKKLDYAFLINWGFLYLALLGVWCQ